MRLELNTQEFGGARQKPGSFRGLPTAISENSLYW
jgi:hypothetical protein